MGVIVCFHHTHEDVVPEVPKGCGVFGALVAVVVQADDDESEHL